jgi:hypothetical protein
VLPVPMASAVDSKPMAKVARAETFVKSRVIL